MHKNLILLERVTAKYKHLSKKNCHPVYLQDLVKGLKLLQHREYGRPNIRIYTVSQKTCHLVFDNNSNKNCWITTMSGSAVTEMI